MAGDECRFRIGEAYVYTEEERDLIKENFDSLGRDEQYQFWEAHRDGGWAKLKKNLKDYYIAVQDYKCPYCLQRIVVEHNGAWDAEHIVPRKSHPHFSFEPQNLCVSCKDCNGEKSDKAVVRSKVKDRFSTNKDDYLMVHPHFDEYSDHVKVISVAGFYLPKTDKGRALVEICGLLRFIYQFSGVEGLDTGSRMMLAKLNDELQNAEDSAQQAFIFGCISDLAMKAQAALREKKIAALQGGASVVEE